MREGGRNLMFFFFFFCQARNTNLLVICKNNMHNVNTPSVDSTLRSMKFSTRHACMRDAQSNTKARALCQRTNMRKRKRERTREKEREREHVHHQTSILLHGLSFFFCDSEMKKDEIHTNVNEGKWRVFE